MKGRTNLCVDGVECKYVGIQMEEKKKCRMACFLTRAHLLPEGFSSLDLTRLFLMMPRHLIAAMVGFRPSDL